MIETRLEAFVQMLGHLREPILLVSNERRIVAGNIAAAEALGASVVALEGAELDSFARSSLGERLRSDASFQLQARDGRRLACAASALTPELFVVRLSSAADAAQRAGAFFDTYARVERVMVATEPGALDELARTLLTLGMSSTSSIAGGLYLLDEAGHTLELVTSLGYPPMYVERFRLVTLTEPMPLTDSVRTATPIFLGSTDDYAARYSEFIRANPRIADRGMACIPLMLDGRCLGALGLGYPLPWEHTAADRAFLTTFAQECARAMARARTRSAERADRGVAAKRLSRLHSFTAALARAITPSDVAEVAVDAGMAATNARTGGLWLMSEDPTKVTLVRAVGPTGPSPDLHANVPLDRPSRLPILDAIRDNVPVWVESSAQIEQRYPDAFRAFSRGDEASIACVPLLAQGRCIGGLSYSFEGAHRFHEDDRALFQLLAWYVAQALERARLYAAERVARRAAEASQQRSAFLASSDSLLASLDYPSRLTAVAACAVPQLADWCIVELEEDRRLGLPAVGAHVDPEKLPFVLAISRRFRELGAPGHGIPEVIRTGKSLLYPSITVDQMRASSLHPELVELFIQSGVVSSMIVPIAARGQTLGAILLNSADPDRSYDHLDLAMAEELGRKVGLAIENARLYRDVREADRMKDEFLAMLGHELRNPLAPIVASLDLMRERGGNTFVNERRLIERNVRHLIRLIDDLLDVARITRGKVQLTPKRLELSDAITDAVDIATPLIEAREHRLSLAVQRRGLPVMIDPVRMAQTIANLLTNAAKYTEPGGTISVSAMAEGGEAVLRVRDTGIGIAPDVLPRIFELFVQAAGTFDRALGGLGIGLTVVKRLVELHGGTVTAHSAGIGHGSEFVVRLPLATGDEAREEPPPAPVPAPVGMRVLVVDDHRDTATVIADLLEAVGCTTMVAHDGASALAASPGFNPDLALLDLGLPRMDGYELARRLRGLGQAMRIVAVTGYGEASDRARSHDAGFDAHVVKPLDLATLRRLIEMLNRTSGQV